MIPTNPLRIPGMLLIRVVLCLVLLLTSVNVQFAAAAPPVQGGDQVEKVTTKLRLRLTYAPRLSISAREITFDDTWKFIFFSDCHRGDNSWADDFAHNQTLFFYALEYYYNKGFTYVEIGDGDELWENKRFEDIRKTHSHVFWLMREFHKENRLYLIWGNHDFVVIPIIPWFLKLESHPISIPAVASILVA